VRKIGHIGATGVPILLTDLTQEHAWIAHPEWVRREGIRSFAGQPLLFRDDILGVLAVFSRVPLDARDFAWLRIFADQAAVAIANARAFEEIERLRQQLQMENDYLRAAVQDELAFGTIIGRVYDRCG
jgi:GAF domain-containing protein